MEKKIVSISDIISRLEEDDLRLTNGIINEVYEDLKELREEMKVWLNHCRYGWKSSDSRYFKYDRTKQKMVIERMKKAI